MLRKKKVEKGRELLVVFKNLPIFGIAKRKIVKNIFKKPLTFSTNVL